MLLTLILQSFWFFLPAGMANMAPVFVMKLAFLDAPIDAHKTYRGKQIFGEHKTYRGFFFGILAAIVVLVIQKKLYESSTLIQTYALFNYEEVNAFTLGFLFGFGALFGDLIESFFKRRNDIPEGKVWIPWDQIDWIIGTIVFIWFVIPIPLLVMVIGLILFGLLHVLMNYFGYVFGIKPTVL
ncbi:CDP-archaeol synthase [Candidatus Woesearchaeota archaeon]|nr:CDP-archaeol synthase [Candidatus Woesearchaeota archaeon]